MSFKNRLQEYYQKEFGILPKYQTYRQGGSDHQPLWQSSLILHDEYMIIGEIQSTKSLAEQSAAENALSYLQSEKERRGKRKVDPGTVLLVDIENLPNLIQEVVEEIEGLDIFGFVGIHHCLVEKPLPDGVTKIISPSTRPDGTDTCMQVYVGSLLVQGRYDTYLIATRDHFGSALVDIITSNLIGAKVKARLITHVDQI
jgi:hypothetical protein